MYISIELLIAIVVFIAIDFYYIGKLKAKADVIRIAMNIDKTIDDEAEKVEGLKRALIEKGYTEEQLQLIGERLQMKRY